MSTKPTLWKEYKEYYAASTAKLSGDSSLPVLKYQTSTKETLKAAIAKLQPTATANTRVFELN